MCTYDTTDGNMYTYMNYKTTKSIGHCTATFSFFFHPIYCLRPSFSLSILVVTQIRGHVAGSSPPLPTTVRALHFYRENISALSSLVDSRRPRVFPNTATKQRPLVGVRVRVTTSLKNSVEVLRPHSSDLDSVVFGFHVCI